ncbi:MAG: hypothetical protein HQL44_03415 [Alphaproteobacteria bacterium]|nr:hypothetical protein [Alphaproteobacteria bacterium]
MITFQDLMGTSLGVFLGITVVFAGGCAIMTGHALGRNWRPIWQCLVYAPLLGMGARFLIYALFQGELLSLSGYLIDTILLTIFTLTAYRTALAALMVRQYPWLYERVGVFGWRQIS